MNMHCGCIIVRCDDCRDRTRSSERTGRKAAKSVDFCFDGISSSHHLIPNVRALSSLVSSGEAKGKSPFALLLGLSGDERGDKHLWERRRPCFALCYYHYCLLCGMVRRAATRTAAPRTAVQHQA